MRCVTSIVLAIAFVSLAARPGEACTCVTNPTSCRALATADAVFEATVESLEVAPAGVTYGGARLRRINLADIKALRGTPEPTIVTPWSSDACGYAFKAGVRYLVVAHRGADGRLAVYSCGETAPLNDAQSQLDYLGTLGDLPGQTRVWGAVYRTSNQIWSSFATTVAGAVVTFKGPTERTVISDATGRFLLTGLPRGSYEVEAVVTTGSAATPLRSSIQRFDWKQDEAFACAALALPIATNGRISGIMRNEYGEPVSGADVLLHSVDPATSEPAEWLTRTRTDNQGRYEFLELPPGSYAATANWSTGPTFIAPHPAAIARTSSGSEVIALGPDEAQTLSPLQLERLAAIPVTGTVRDQRGAPVEGVQIGGWGIHHNGARYPIPTPVVSGANGQFELLLWRGQRYAIEVSRNGTRLASLELVASTEGITITVPR
jgi:hypothetical protein